MLGFTDRLTPIYFTTPGGKKLYDMRSSIVGLYNYIRYFGL